jgi:Predicted signal transduction protein with a C-terminal ATPase domain
MKKDKPSIWRSIKNYRSKSIIIRNFILILLLIILPLSGIGILFYHNMNSMLEQEIGEINTNALFRIKDIVDNLFHGLNRLASQISISGDENVFFLSSSMPINVGTTYKNINKDINMFTLVYNYLDSIYLYSERKGFIISNRDSGTIHKYGDMTWFESYMKSKDNDSIIVPRKKNEIYPYLISLIKPVYYNENEKLGAIVINVDIEELIKLVHQTGNKISENIIIANRAGMIMYSSDKNMIMKNMKELDLYSKIPLYKSNYSGIKDIGGIKYIISITTSSYQDWRYISMIPLTHYENELGRMANLLIKLLLAGIIIALILSFLITVTTFEPLRNILTVLSNLDKWDNKSASGIKEDDNEIKHIAGVIMKTIYSNKKLEEELQNRMAMLNKAQSAALQAQINPHFLYNTMDAVKWKAISLTNGRNEVSDMITSLSELFRIFLDAKEQFVSIAEEIKYTRLYIKIMKMRFKDKFSVEWDIDEVLMNYKTIRICMQPLIENAIYHGINPGDKNGTIYISGRMEEEAIIIDISDNGIGMPASELDDINEIMKKEYLLDDRHIGIYNVNQRFRLCMGDDYGLTLMHGLGHGIVSRLKIKKIQ